MVMLSTTTPALAVTTPANEAAPSVLCITKALDTSLVSIINLLAEPSYLKSAPVLPPAFSLKLIFPEFALSAVL